jgi:hypothetical protein
VDAETFDPLAHVLKWLKATRYRSSNPGSSKIFSLYQTVKKGSVAHTASYSIGTEFISEGYRGQDMKLTYDLHVTTMLRMREL